MGSHGLAKGQKMRSNITKLLGFAAAFAAAAYVVGRAEKSAVAAAMKDARFSLFDVADDCSAITFKGGGSLPDPAQLELARQHFFSPFVAEHLDDARLEAGIHGVTVAQFITAQLLYAMFPECNQAGARPWPPTDLWSSGTFGIIWSVTLGIVLDYVPEADK